MNNAPSGGLGGLAAVGDESAFQWAGMTHSLFPCPYRLYLHSRRVNIMAAKLQGIHAPSAAAIYSGKLLPWEQRATKGCMCK